MRMRQTRTCTWQLTFLIPLFWGRLRPASPLSDEKQTLVYLSDEKHGFKDSNQLLKLTLGNFNVFPRAGQSAVDLANQLHIVEQGVKRVEVGEANLV